MPWAYAPEWLELSLGCDSQNLQLGLFASSSPNLSPREYFGSATGSPSGTISKPSTHDPGSGWSSLSPQGSHVNPSPPVQQVACERRPTVLGDPGMKRWFQ